MSIPLVPPNAGPGASIVACVQLEPRVGDKAGNVAKCLARIEEAASHGASLVVLPELANSGYVFASRQEAFDAAEPMPHGPTAQAWIETARRLGIYLVAGIAERAGERLYNSALVTGPQGYIGTYRKLHLWGEENVFFEPGDLGLPVFHTELGRIGVAICYDGWFPEVYRRMALAGADIVCVPTNWVPMPGQPADREAMANVLAMASAHSNGLLIASASRVGTERGQPFIGRSLIVSNQGWPLAGPADAESEQILYAQFNIKQMRSERVLNAFNCVLRDRREEVYGPAPTQRGSLLSQDS